MPSTSASAPDRVDGTRILVGESEATRGLGRGSEGLKLYDDFKFDVEGELDEYHARFFGPGGAGMKKFHTALEERWMKLGRGGESRSWWGKLGTRDFLAELSGYVAEAREATAEGSLYRRRVELIDAGILQYLLEARARFERSTVGEYAPISTAAVARVLIPDGQDWADDKTWADAMEQVVHKTADNEPVAQGTRFRLAYDDKRFYIKARMSEPLVSKMKAASRTMILAGSTMIPSNCVSTRKARANSSSTSASTAEKPSTTRPSTLLRSGRRRPLPGIRAFR